MNTKQRIQIIIGCILLCVVPIINVNAQWVKTNSFVSPNGHLAYPHPSAAYCSNNGNAGGGELFKSVDSGKTWQLIYNFGAFTSTERVVFLNADTGFVQQINQMHRTTDGGLTWQRLPDLFAPAFLQTFVGTLKSRGDTIYISAARGDTSVVFQSVDLGVTFTRIYQLIEPNALPLFVSFYTNQDAYIMHPKNDSTAFVTHNNFISIDTFSNYNMHVSLEPVMSFVDSIHGFFYGKSGAFSFPARLSRNANGINTFLLGLDNTGVLPALDMELGLASINNRVYACSEYGKIFWSNNWGQNWIEQQTPVNNQVRSIAFATPNIGIAIAADGAIYTRNGGDFPNSVFDQALSDAIKIYPNPVTDNIFFEIKNNSEIESVRILNISGQQVLEAKHFTNRISINSLAKGHYQIVFEDKKGRSAIKRFVKQ